MSEESDEDIAESRVLQMQLLDHTVAHGGQEAFVHLADSRLCAASYVAKEKIDNLSMPTSEIPSHNNIIADQISTLTSQPARNDVSEDRTLAPMAETLPLPTLLGRTSLRGRDDNVKAQGAGEGADRVLAAALTRMGQCQGASSSDFESIQIGPFRSVSGERSANMDLFRCVGFRKTASECGGQRKIGSLQRRPTSTLR